MTPADASNLTDRFMHTWPKMVIPPDEWEDVLRELDAGTAGTAFIRLRNTSKYPPSIAEFLDTYRALPTAHNQPIPNLCQHCGGDGFITDHQAINDHEYEVAKACRCSSGPNAQRQLDEAEARNAEQRARLWPYKYARQDRAA